MLVNNNLQIVSHITQSLIHNDTMSVIEESNSLASYVRQVMDKKRLSARDIERISGKKISHSYVNKIKNGTATNPSPTHLQALAKGLGESEDLIFAKVRGEPHSTNEIPLRIKTEGFEGLDDNDLSEIAEFIKFKKMQKK